MSIPKHERELQAPAQVLLTGVTTIPINADMLLLACELCFRGDVSSTVYYKNHPLWHSKFNQKDDMNLCYSKSEIG